ncbi:MAG TPA: hypothetical protein VGG46_11255 [Terriglobales bacterium]
MCWGTRASDSAQELTRETLFEDLHDRGGIAALRLTDEKVEVFGHDDVAHDDEMILATDLFEDFQKQIGRREVPNSGRRW